MKKDKIIIIETTYPNLESAKNLGKILLGEKLIGCIHFHPIESMYEWQGKIENSAEFLLRIKTKNSLYHEVEKIIKKHHSYKTPEIIAIDVEQTEKNYLLWLENSTIKLGK